MNKESIINVGSYDRKITIQRLSTTVGDSGNVVESWVTIFVPWAKVVAVKSSEDEEADGQYSKSEYTFEIRYCSEVEDLNTTHRIVFDSQAFDILGVVPMPAGRPYKFLITAETRSDFNVELVDLSTSAFEYDFDFSFDPTLEPDLEGFEYELEMEFAQ